MTNSEKIRQLYEESGLSYSELSKLLDVPYNTLANWLMGRRNPPDYIVEMIRTKLEQIQSEKRYNG